MREVVKQVLWAILVLGILAGVFHHITITNGILQPESAIIEQFNMITATQMVEKGDKLISDLTKKEEVSREEYKTFLREANIVYNGYDEGIWVENFFDEEQYKYQEGGKVKVDKHLFYPTLYDKDIEVVSAEITTEFFERIKERTYLTIRVSYLGNDENLRGWWRDYIYDRNEKGEWAFHGFEGHISIFRDDYGSNNLETKQ